MFSRWSRLTNRHPKIVLAVSALVLILTGVSLALPGKLSHDSVPEQAESTQAMRLIEAQVRQAEPHGFTLLFSHPSLSAHDEAFATEVLRAIAPLRDDQRVERVLTPYDGAGAYASDAGQAPHEHIDDSMLSGSHAVAIVQLDAAQGDVHEQMAAYKDLRAKVISSTLQVHATGGLAVSDAFTSTLAKDLMLEVYGLPIVLVLLVVVFGTLVAALLPLGVGILAVMGGLGGTLFVARYIDVSMYATNVITLIGLGVAIDYSLFIVSRFREELAKAPRDVALSRTLETAGRAVFFSGLTVAVGLLGLTFYSGLYFASMGIGGAIVVAFAVIYALTFLPALLALLGPRINKLKLPGMRLDRPARPFWGRIAKMVMRRPTPILLGTVTIIAVAAAPFAGLQLASSGIEALPESHEVRQAAAVLQSEFPHRGTNTIIVVVKFPGDPLTPARVGALYDTSRAIGGIQGVTSVESIVDLSAAMSREEYVELYSGERAGWPAPAADAVAASVGDSIVVMLVRAEPTYNTQAARALVEQIRAMPPLGDGHLLVSGPTAMDADIAQIVKDRTPWAVGFVVVATFVLVLLQTGSVILPIKAVLMNVLSIGASFGALVWIFQEGNLSELLNFTPAPLDPSVPVLLFCIVFGLSMDYEVLMLSRMHEEYERTRDNTQAVASGLELSGRLITSAALIMVVVFAAFIASQVTIMKAIGLGLALAIAIDATIVRALIVPAAMRLMGSANWWAPPALRRLTAPFREEA